MKKPNVQYIAVKALIKNADGRALVIKQSDTTISNGNKYHPPGGILEPGESLTECLLREVEEIGVDAEVVSLFDVGEWCARRGDTLMQFVGIFYVCRIVSSNFKLQAAEVSEVAWVGSDGVDDLAIVEPSKTMVKKFLSSS